MRKEILHPEETFMREAALLRVNNILANIDLCCDVSAPRKSEDKPSELYGLLDITTTLLAIKHSLEEGLQERSVIIDLTNKAIQSAGCDYLKSRPVPDHFPKEQYIMVIHHIELELMMLKQVLLP